MLNDLNLELKERIENKKPTKTHLGKIEAVEKRIGKAKEFYEIFKIYEQKLSQNGLIDYADMINLVLNKMEEDFDFLKEAVKDYEFVLVDEYQDTSKVQNDLIFNILKGTNTDNIFAVGDDDQIIYSFQGARSRNLSDFLEKYPNANVICLIENRRSTQTILDFSEALIEQDHFRLTNNKNFDIQKKLIAKNEKVIAKTQPIKFNIYSELVQENNKIIEEIERLINEGVKLSEIAILSRKNDQLENFARLLKQKNIPFVLSKQKNGFEVPSFIQVYFYLKILINSFLEQEKIFGLLSREPFKIKDETIAKILEIKRKSEKSLMEIIKDYEDDEDIKKFYSTYSILRNKKSYLPLVPLIYEIISQTRILNYYSNNGEARFENINAIQRLIDEANSYSMLHKGATLDEFVRHLDTYFKQGIKIELKKNEFKIDAVQLVTYHGSKGREFDYVFMPNLTAKAFEKSVGQRGEIELPIKKSVFSDDKDENKDAEILRLLFVGITRAKFGLYLSYANAIEGTAQVSSKYISNLFPENNHLIKQEIFDIDKDTKLEETVKNLKLNLDNDDYKFELQNRVQEIKLSQATLNKYLKCPLEYFYSKVLEVPVFVEDVDILSYGSSIHHSIDLMTKDAIKNKKWNPMDKMKEYFLEKLNRSEFSTDEKREEYKKRGLASIEKNYLRFIESSPEFIINAEYKMEKEFEGVNLIGFADRITKDNQGNIQIFDFKTGSYKKVKPDEDYYNQLRFYKFLYEYINPEEKVSETSLIFFEEDLKRATIEEDLTNNEEIKNKIKTVIQNIKNLNFEPTDNENNCKHCHYKLVCRLNCND